MKKTAKTAAKKTVKKKTTAKKVNKPTVKKKVTAKAKKSNKKSNKKRLGSINTTVMEYQYKPFMQWKFCSYSTYLKYKNLGENVRKRKAGTGTWNNN